MDPTVMYYLSLWPQIAIASTILASLVYTVNDAVRINDTDLVWFAVACHVVYIWVLHMGGFW